MARTLSMALSDPRRVEVVEQLAKGSQCGTVLAETLGISVALLSHHWEILVQAGILHKERQGQLRVCSLDCDRLREAMTIGGAWELSIAPPPKKPAPAKSAPPTNERPARSTNRRSRNQPLSPNWVNGHAPRRKPSQPSASIIV